MTVTITRKTPVKSGTADVVPASTVVDQSDDEGMLVRKKHRDYLVLRSDFETIVGVGEVPKLYDEIVEVVGDYTRTFAVVELGEETFRYWDKGYQVFRIHTEEMTKVTTTTATTTTGTTTTGGA